jgi:organic radical activating enzyme
VTKPKQVNINLLYGYRCNYNCQGCISNSDVESAPEDELDLSRLLDSIPILANTFDVTGMITLLGGEPFLYWDSHIVPLALKVNKYFPRTRINIFSNGQLLTKFLDKFIKLSEEVTYVNLEISRHLIGFEHTKMWQVWQAGVDYLEHHDRIYKIHDDHYHVKDNIFADIRFTPATKDSWLISFKHLSNGNIKPYATNDPEASMKYGCSAGSVCAVVKNGFLYKCSLLATLDHGLTRRKQLDDPEWQKYLSYQPIDLFNSNTDHIQEYMKTYGKAITECDMCCNQPNQRGTVQRTYDMIFKKKL